jgi:hypothetical protein
MRKFSICLFALLIAMTVSAMVIAANRKAPEVMLRSGGVPVSSDDLLF